MSFGKEVKKARIDKGWRQYELQAKAGLSQWYLSQIERDEADPRLSTIVRLAQVLEVDIAQLVDLADYEDGGSR